MQRICLELLYIIKAQSEMKKLLLLSIISLGIITTTGCYKDIDNSPEPTIIVERPDIKINTTLHGVVTDFNGNVSDNYTIEIDGQSYVNDQNYYFLDLENINKKNQHISIIRDGNEIAFANVSLIENDNNKVNFLTFPEWSTKTISVDNNIIELDEALDVQINSNEVASITFGAIKNQQALNQLGKWGRDEENKDYFLNTRSSFFIDSETLSMDNSPMSLEYDLSTFINNENIALFHLNEVHYQWILVDKINSNTGTIELPSFGYYILANTNNSTFIEGEILYENLPMAFQKVDFTLIDNNSINLKTTANGRWSSFLPTDMIAELSISDPCQNIIYDQEIATSELDIQTILTSDDSENIIPLHFNNIDCDGSYTNTPGSIINFGSEQEVMVFPKEQVDIATLTCGELNIKGYDILSNQSGVSVTWNEEIEDNLEQLSTCEEYADGFSFLKINGEMKMLPVFSIAKEDGKTIFESQESNIRLIIKGEEVGNYATNQVNFFIDDANFGSNGYRMYCENSLEGCGIDDCYISHFEEMDNGLTRITFSGVLWMQTITNPTAGNYPIEGQILIAI